MAARYSTFLGKRVEVFYRSNDIYLPATGTLAGDSGRSIFLEEHCNARGRTGTFRWEIPYNCIVRVSEALPPPEPAPVREDARLLMELDDADDLAGSLEWRSI
jgi:hypothetical protein